MIRFFLRNRVVTNLLSLFFLGVGLTLFFRAKREAFPEIRFDIVTVTTFYPGASPEDVERLVTGPIEDELKAVDGVDRVESYSVESRSVIVVRIEEELSDDEVARAALDVEQAVNRVKDLPEGAEEPVVTELTSDRPLIALSVAGGDAAARDAFAERLEDALEDLEGVSKVVAEGDPPKEIQVEARLDELLRRRLTLSELAAAIRERNADLSAGAVLEGGKERLVRTVGGLETAADVEGVIVRGNDERSFLRVGDVAAVRDAYEDEKLEVRAMGRPAVKLQVFKRKEGDSIRLADAVLALKAKLEPEARERGLSLHASDDLSFFIRRRLKVMTGNLAQGGALILATLFIFLEWRVAIAAALGVPAAFAAAMALAIPFGFTINLLTLLALIIVAGMVDDDSVVVAENIYRHLEMGKPPEAAAEEGAREVVVAVIAAVGTTMAAFLPFAMVSGIMGKFLFMIPVTVVLCLGASLLESFWILPSHVVDLHRAGLGKVRVDRDSWFARLGQAYRRFLAWSFDHRYKFLAFSVLALVGTTALGFARLRLILFPEGLIDQFFIQVDMERGTPLERTRGALEEAERAVLRLPPGELDVMTGTVGLKGYEETVRRGTHLGQVQVFLKPQADRARPTRETIAQLRRELSGLPGVEKVVFETVRPGPPTGNAVQVRVRGRDPAVLERMASELKAALAAMPGVSDVRDSSEGGKDQLRVRLRHGDAAYGGLGVARVAREVLTAVDGWPATEIRRDREEVKVRVRLAPGDRTPERLRELRVPAAAGRQVRLGSVAELEPARGPAYIEHYGFRRSLTVLADVDNERVTSFEANAALKERFKDLARAEPGYELIFGGEEENTRESLVSLRRAMAVALVLDFVILAGLFNSYVQPLLIMLTIPIGLVGVTLALVVHGEPATFMAMLGTVALTGVVVNNAVLIIDFVNAERAKGLTLRQAVIEAGSLRLRPVMASSLTTLAGLFPTAYGWGGKEPFVQPMCLALAWGLAFALPFTLMLIPVFYIIVDDVAGWFRARRERRRAAAPAPVPAPAPR